MARRTPPAPFLGAGQRLRKVAGDAGKSQRFTGRSIKRVKILEVAGKPGELPSEDGIETEIIRDAGIRSPSSFNESDFPDDGPRDAYDIAYIRLEVHTISQIPELLVNVEGLRVNDNLTVILPLELEKLGVTLVKALEVPGIPDQPGLVDEEDGVRLRGAAGETSDVEEPDARNIDIRHISIDMPATTEMLEHELHHIGTLAGALLAKKKDELIRIREPARVNGKASEENENK